VEEVTKSVQKSRGRESRSLWGVIRADF
jgi:hypothetical protein